MKQNLCRHIAMAVMFLVAALPCTAANEAGTPTKPLIFYQENAERIQPGQRLAILLSGNNGLLARFIEDAIAIHLSNAGLGIATREQLEKAMADRLAETAEGSDGGSIDATTIGKAVGAVFVITGSVIATTTESGNVVVDSLSLQVLDTASGEAPIRVLLECEDEAELSSVAKQAAKIILRDADR